MHSWSICLFATVLAISASTAIGGEPVDANAALSPDARAFLLRFTTAASSRDWITLRAILSDDFKHSFGFDGDDSDKAVEKWRKNPVELDEMVRVVERGCFQDTTTGNSIECPGETETGLRGGMSRDPSGQWKLKWFLAGD